MRPEEIEFVKKMVSVLDEHTRRLFLGGYSTLLGYGGRADLHRCAGDSPTTIAKGEAEFQNLDPDRPASEYLSEHPPAQPVRNPGGGRKPLTEKFPGLSAAMLSLMDGSGSSSIRWTTKSHKDIREELASRGISVSVQKIKELWDMPGMDTSRYRAPSDYTGGTADKVNKQYKFIEVAANIFILCGFPVLYLEMDGHGCSQALLTDIAAIVIDLWCREYCSHGWCFSSVMVVPYSATDTQLLSKKIASAISKNVLVSALPYAGISKWAVKTSVLEFNCDYCSARLYRIDSSAKKVPIDTAKKEAIISRLVGTIKDPLINSYCNYRKPMN